MRKVLNKLHLIIGLLSGIIIFIICITGCIYTFKTEITNTYWYTKVDNSTNSPKLKLSELIDIYQASSDYKIDKLYDYKDPNKATVLKTRNETNKYTTYINPYTGAIIKTVDTQFFTIVLRIHRSLLLGNIGGQIIAWSVVAFIICLCTGILLWIPKKAKSLFKRKTLKAKLTIKRKSSFSRRVYDLHSVLGIYAVIFLLIICISGLVWSFKTVDRAIYKIVSLETKPAKKRIRIKPCKLKNTSFDIIKNKIYNLEGPSYTLTKYSFPRSRRLPIKVLSAETEGEYAKSNTYYVHPQTGKILKQELHKNMNNAQKLRRSNYDIHTGSIWGIWGKILVFIVSLIGASLPITGICFFVKRQRKKHK